MKLFSAVSLVLICVFSSGCIGYTKFRSSNLRGELIAEWTAKGAFYPVDGGYRINAIERISGPPYSHISFYPHGWRTTVTGPNIERWHVRRPVWLNEVTTTTDTKEVISYQDGTR